MKDGSLPYPIVAVKWRDAHADPIGTWTNLDELEDCGPYHVISVGFLLPSVKADHVSVAQSLDPEENIDTILHIPVKMVEEVVLFTNNIQKSDTEAVTLNDTKGP